ncbi:MAG TPA: 5-(carboxyamino)imidazole ribonucleotide mutase [Candidatus Paceibacterota bacterium]|jgi:5-(carboxyamino)imidazole ribonucleotide mutase|nr:5-(carboxyamino)imidazole ribonucleotide mutase [Candidatus Paceibacterota bacterium]
MKKDTKVGIIMGSDSDLALMQEAAKVLEEFNIPFELTLVSAHRTPERMAEYGKSAASRGLKVIIACTGGAAHLPGMVASYTTLPVIGVPRKLKSMEGLDSLLSMTQMPAGIPVATVAIDGAKNAGLLAARIVGTSDEKIQKKIEKYAEDLNRMVTIKAEKLEKIGYKKYLGK